MLNQMNLDICRTYHLKATKYTLFSSAQEHSPRQILGHKSSLNKFEKNEIISRFFFLSTWHETKNQLQNRSGKFANMQIKQHAPGQRIKEEKQRIKKIL